MAHGQTPMRAALCAHASQRNGRSTTADRCRGLLFDTPATCEAHENLAGCGDIDWATWTGSGRHETPVRLRAQAV